MKWKAEVGLGYATPIVIGDRVFMFSRRDQDEVIAAFDAMTGKELWHTNYAAHESRQSRGPARNGSESDAGIRGQGNSHVRHQRHSVHLRCVQRQVALAEGGSACRTHVQHVAVANRRSRPRHRSYWRQQQGGASPPSTSTPVQSSGSGPAMGLDTGRRSSRSSAVCVRLSRSRNRTLSVCRPDRRVAVATTVRRNEINALTPLVYGGMLIVSGQDQGVQALRIARKGEQWTVEDVWRNRRCGFA